MNAKDKALVARAMEAFETDPSYLIEILYDSFQVRSSQQAQTDKKKAAAEKKRQALIKRAEA